MTKYPEDNEFNDLPEAPVRTAGEDAPLAGIRVIDLSHFIAGPLAAMTIADLGAEVIKVEPPGRGDELRYYPPPHRSREAMSAPFVWANRNKRGMVLDLKTEAGRKLCLQLIARSDVLLENFSTGVMDRLGLGYERCRLENERLVYCSLSAYGRDGSFSDRRGFDPVVQAESGFMSMNGDPDRDGVRTGATIMDISAGMMTSNAILAALMARERTGKGQFVEVSLFDSAMTAVGYATMQYMYTGKEVGRSGNASPDTSPTGVFHAKDKAFYLSCTTTKLFRKVFTEVVARPDVVDHPKYQTPQGRLDHRRELVEILGREIAKRDWEYWQARFLRAGVPVGEVRSLKEAISSPEAVERGLFNRIPDRSGGWLPNVSLPFRFSKTPVVQPVAAPLLGEHTASVVTETLGHDDEQIAILAKEGAFGDGFSHA